MTQVKVYDQAEKLYESIPQELLPAEYGGKAGSIPDIMETWVKKVQEYKQYFEDDVKYGVDEKLRPGEPKNAETLFGIDGTFRQLEMF